MDIRRSLPGSGRDTVLLFMIRSFESNASSPKGRLYCIDSCNNGQYFVHIYINVVGFGGTDVPGSDSAYKARSGNG
jgi:hypothetical protein